jgi:hypothetical protein
MSVCNRLIVLMLVSILVVGFGSYLVFSAILFGNGQIGVLFSIPVGIVFGALMCWYIAKTHDLRTWRPKDPNWEYSNDKFVRWGVIVGLILTSFAARFLGLFARGFILETLGIGFLVVIGFTMFHRCRSNKDEKTG